MMWPNLSQHNRGGLWHRGLVVRPVKIVFGAVDAWRLGCGKCVVWCALPVVEAVILGKVEVLQDMFNRMVVNLMRAYARLRASHNCIGDVRAASDHHVDELSYAQSVAKTNFLGQLVLECMVGVTCCRQESYNERFPSR
jgi:hypothetical protein